MNCFLCTIYWTRCKSTSVSNIFFFKILLLSLLIRSLLVLKKIRNYTHFKYEVICLASKTSAALMALTASAASVASMNSVASFHQNLSELDFLINPCTKMTYSGLSMWDRSSKLHCFVDFWHPRCRRLWRPSH